MTSSRPYLVFHPHTLRLASFHPSSLTSRATNVTTLRGQAVGVGH